jgi:hypothetical protein
MYLVNQKSNSEIQHLWLKIEVEILWRSTTLARFRTRLVLSLVGQGAFKCCQIFNPSPFSFFTSPFSVGIPPSPDQVMKTGVRVYASHTYTSSELYTRKGKCKRGSGLGFSPSPGPRRKRTSHTVWLFFLSPSPSVEACFRVHCNLQFIRACQSRQVLVQ